METTAYEAMRAALRAVVEADGGLDRYDHEDDEVGSRACCGVISYQPHESDCYVVRAREALAIAEAAQ